jgi:hypothetical protein
MLSRRDFLFASLFGTMGIGYLAKQRLQGLGKSPRQAYLATALVSQDLPRTQINAINPTVKSELRILPLEAKGNARSIPVPMLPHSISQNPVQRELVAGCEKWGTGAVQLSFLSGQIHTAFASPKGYRFFGHTAYLPDGRHFLMTGNRYEDQSGVLFLYETASVKLVDTFPTGGQYPHDIHVDASGEWAMVANHFLKTATGGLLTFIELGSRKILRKMPTPHVAHIAKMDTDLYAVSGGTGKAGATLIWVNIANGGSGSYLDAKGVTEPIMSEGLSLTRIDRNRCAVTFPDTLNVGLWDISKNEMLILPFETGTMGLQYAGDRIYVNTLPHGDLFQIQAGHSEPTAFLGGFGNGRHMTLLEA